MTTTVKKFGDFVRMWEATKLVAVYGGPAPERIITIEARNSRGAVTAIAWQWERQPCRCDAAGDTALTRCDASPISAVAVRLPQG